MNALLRRLRLLPAVIAVTAALLMLKSAGFVRSAWAQEGQIAASADSSVLAQDTKPLPKDVSADDNENSSPAEVDVLTSLAKRRAALDARAAEIKMRADVLAAAEARVDGKILTLKQLQQQITTLLAERDDAQKQQIASLVKTYSAMKSKDAARIFEGLSDDVVLPVAQAMKSDVLAPILAAMNPDSAQKLTTKLANRLKLPELAAPPQPPAPQAATQANKAASSDSPPPAPGKS